jgi:hypothetical protein
VFKENFKRFKNNFIATTKRPKTRTTFKTTTIKWFKIFMSKELKKQRFDKQIAKFKYIWIKFLVKKAFHFILQLPISGYCYQKGCYYPNSYTLRARRTDPCFENELLLTGIAIILIANGHNHIPMYILFRHNREIY